ncbi:PREDICTED: nucleolar protein 16 [Ceratosolen solmsi marchali]|uniref:Nucleolar protein 16 n=1 Tax=Ceratosolen solmsi marchali TaxID=326594 RepID=A0AAJ6YUT4_9HYME|nr:PREDICTED: nucleolar protein 16 [Ceratosolen solmsi marchali]
MVKIKKLKRKKRFRVNINRKRLRNKLRKLPNIECNEIKNAWNLKKSTVSNLSQMGLAYDPNQVLKIPNRRQEMLTAVTTSDENNDSQNVKKGIKRKLYVAQNLEEDAKYPRARLFRLPNNEVQFATYMIDKYGEDYKAMVKDRKNYNQYTWHQIKKKIDKFKSIPEQYAEYLVKKGEFILEDSTPLKKIKPSVQQSEVKINSKRVKRKKKKPKLVSIWHEETVDNELNNNLINDSIDDSGQEIIPINQINNENKLKLFSDDETENDVSTSQNKSSDNIK